MILCPKAPAPAPAGAVSSLSHGARELFGDGAVQSTAARQGASFSLRVLVLEPRAIQLEEADTAESRVRPRPPHPPLSCHITVIT